MLLNLKKCTPNAMVLGELGRVPLEFNTKCRMLGFWYSMVTDNNNKISCIMYKLLINLHCSNLYKSEWVSTLFAILRECGMNEYLNNTELVQNTNFAAFKKLYKDNLMQLYKDNWLNTIEVSSKCSLYRNFKDDPKLEKYLFVLPKHLSLPLTRLRTSNHRMPIETGRYLNVERKDRICMLCTSNDIGDEYHYCMCCPYFENLRK